MAEIKSYTLRFADVITKAFEELKVKIGENIKGAGKWASGKTYDSMRVVEIGENDALSIALVGREDFHTLELGNPPKPRPIREFTATIHQWSIDKGIVPRIPRSDWSYLVARKINAKGDILFCSGSPIDIYSSASRKTATAIAEELHSRVNIMADSMIVEIAKGVYGNDIIATL